MAIAKDRLTDEQLMQLPEDGFKHEYVDGEVVNVPTSGKHDEIILELAFRVRPLLSGMGAMSCGQSGFRMASGNVRVPDFSFMVKERLPGGQASDGFAEGAPDLCVEVVSPSERPAEIHQKIAEFFESGAKVVWIIQPEARSVVIYHSEDVLPHTYTDGDALTLPEFTPDFRCPVEDLFATIG